VINKVEMPWNRGKNMNQVCSKGQKRKIMSTKVKNPRELSVGIHEKQVKSEHAERLHHFNKKLCDLDIK